MPIRGVVFDKDGTLIDFHATWDPVFVAILDGLAGGDPARLRAAAEAVGFDVAAGVAAADSPLRSESNAELADRLAPVFGRGAGDLAFVAEVDAQIESHAPSTVTEVEGATTVLEALVRRGVPLGVATNDSEASARLQIDELGWSAHFVSVLGYDSGHGAKPGPGMVTAIAAAMNLPVQEVAMVGDSRQDLAAARAAGAVAVLVGHRRDLCDQADIVIASLDGLLAHLAESPREPM